MKAEIVVSGSELLLGETIDTNSAMMARMLRDVGIDLFFKTTVGDNQQRMASVLSIAMDRADVIITSGGLGPTVDDVTREAVAKATQRPLVFHPELFAQIEARFARFGRPMTENNRRQAFIPEGAIPVENQAGTAPAFIVEDDRATIISLPGVPRELEFLMKTRIIPYLQERMGEKAVIFARVLRTCAVGESQIDSRIGDLMRGSNPTVGLLAHAGIVDIRVAAKASDLAAAKKLIEPIEAELRSRLGHAIYGEGEEKLQDLVACMLAERRVSLALLDTLTAGQLSEALSNTEQGIIPITDRRFSSLREAAGNLNWGQAGPPLLSQTASEQAAGQLRADSGADLALVIWNAEAGPDADRSESDFSGVSVSLASPDGVFTRSFGRAGGETFRRRWVIIGALDLVRRYLIGGLDDWIE